MRLYLIRHGMTKGNREKRYVGVTDEALLPNARALLMVKKLPEVHRLYVSPMKRCLETAAILYPGSRRYIVEDFRECDFGDFEYCNYKELNKNPRYEEFINTMGRSGFPGGESRAVFQERCIRGFEQIMAENAGNAGDIAIVAHGGTLMSLLDFYSCPHRDYYEWQAANGEGYVTRLIRKPDGSFKMCDVIQA